jgi:hypothetical protein
MKPKNEQKTERIAVRLGVVLHKNLLKTAKRHKERPSETIRKALAFYLAQH